ncbi:MAG TPA: hypothetical protein IGS37_19235 [Synechococcales cyanobacterium M55_K2018_004]|nr:hypothetical protein [Synechococcales cyanobacterium M55_K2018_004]
MKILSSLGAFALTAVSLAPVAQAQQSQRINIPSYYATLRYAVCQQQWNRAIALLDHMIASPQFSQRDRDQLIAYQFSIEQYRRNDTRFSVVPGCENPSNQTPVPQVNRSDRALPQTP